VGDNCSWVSFSDENRLKLIVIIDTRPVNIFFGAGGNTAEKIQVFTKQELYHLSHASSTWLWLFWRWGPENYLSGVASNRDPPDFSLPKVTRIIGISHWHLATL
jgi:hypothetical protein